MTQHGRFLATDEMSHRGDEYLFKLNKFHLTMPMARYGNRPIRVGVNIQKKCSDFHKREHRARLHHNSKQLHECEVRVTRIATP